MTRQAEHRFYAFPTGVFAGIEKTMRMPYPFLGHCICLMPTMIFLGCVRVVIGPEDAVFAYFTSIRQANPSLTLAVAAFTHGVLFVFYPVYAFFLAWGLRGKRPADVLFALCYVAAQILIAALLCRLIKIAVGRPRPMTGGPFVPFSFGWGYQSFPSGHTAEALGSSLPFIWRYAGASPLLMPLLFGILLAAVAFTRVYLGMHHPTDIWGGLVFGSLSGYASWTFYGFMLTRWQRFLPDRLRARMETAGE